VSPNPLPFFLYSCQFFILWYDFFRNGIQAFSEKVNPMKYLWTFFWTFLLAQMMTFVVGSIKSTPYSFETGLKLAVGMTVLLLIIPRLLPEEKAER
jgi:uncharacterized membrane protein